MPFVTIRRFSFDWVNPNDLPNYGGAPRDVVIGTMLKEIERDVQGAIAAVAELEITPNKVMVSIPEDQERDGSWWQNPTVEIVFAHTELRTPVVKKAALDAACRAVLKKYPEGYLNSVRGHYSTMDRATQYVKITADDLGSYADVKKMVGELVEACKLWALLADDADEKPMLAGNPIEWETTEHDTFRIVHHIEGEQHTYVESYPNGDISITLSLPLEGASHELSLRKGQEPLYSHDPSQFSAGFPEGRFFSWLRTAIDACTMM